MDRYEWFINNKKIDVLESLNSLFKNTGRIELFLDDQKWNNYLNAIKEDYLNSKKIKFIIYKLSKFGNS